MNIGVSTSASQGKNIVDLLNYLDNENIDYVEFLYEYPNRDINSKFLESYSFSYTVHSPISDMNIASLNPNLRQTSVNEVKKSIDLASEINANLTVVHPGIISFLGRLYKEKVIELAHNSIMECFDYGQDSGVKISVENMPNIDGHLYQDPSQLNKFLKVSNIDMTLDIGHANTVIKKTDLFFDTINHIHLSDNNADSDHHYPLGQGNINFKDVFSTLSKHKFNGIYIVEMNNMEDVKKSLDYLKKINILN
ncbi:MAG: sugar phosphate isomerase/epimerase [Methanobrevibacter sp.]|jgi:sugar phosphate isomerase/epimerase|nr:sugar phosphate isomerase/epimerase [Candidatus Methanovirga australis]